MKNPCKSLIYKGFCRDDWIRTSGLFVPNEARYQAALHPDSTGHPRNSYSRNIAHCTAKVRIFIFNTSRWGKFTVELLYKAKCQINSDSDLLFPVKQCNLVS